MNTELYLRCVALACRIQQRVKDQYPNSEGIVAIEASYAQGTQDTSFQRRGTSTTERGYTLPSDLLAIIKGSLSQPDTGAGLVDSENQLLSGLLTQDKTSVPSLEVLLEAMSTDPAGFTGYSALSEIINRNPYSNDYESATTDLYNRMFDRARSSAMSGPANIRGAQGAQALELADLGTNMSINRFKEIRGQQDKEAGIVSDAVRLYSTLENLRRGTRLQAQQQRAAGEASRSQESLAASGALGKKKGVDLANVQLASELLGKPKVVTTDDLSGRGNTSSSSANIGGGMSCCFIFLECLNGELPWYVRKGRDDFRTENRINGYRWMSVWLVPLMQKHNWLKLAVNSLVVKPFLKWGRALYVHHQKSAWKPYCWTWFHVWSFLGKLGLKG